MKARLKAGNQHKLFSVSSLDAQYPRVIDGEGLNNLGWIRRSQRSGKRMVRVVPFDNMGRQDQRASACILQGGQHG